MESKLTDLKANDASQEDNDGTAKRTCILVLGMHRSGTSAITRVLSYMGAALPQNILGASESNQAGHWEPENLVSLNDELLTELDSSWDDWQAIDLTQLTSDRLLYYKNQIKKLIKDDFKDAKLFVLKDPRVCKLLSFYKEIFSEINVELKIVSQFRNPIEVMDSLKNRDGMLESDGALLWLDYVLNSERTSRGLERVFIKYDDVINDWKKSHERIRSSLNINWPYELDEIEDQIDQFISPKLCHHSHKDEEVLFDPLLRQWVGEAYSALLVLQKNPNSETAQKRLDEIADEFEKASPMLVKIKSTVSQSYEKQLDEGEQLLAQKKDVIAKHKQLIAQTNEIIAEREQQIAQNDEMIAERDQQIAQKDEVIAESEKLIAQKDQTIAERENKIIQKDELIANRDKIVAGKNALITERNKVITGLYNSNSWKLTKPFRFLRHTIFLINKKTFKVSPVYNRFLLNKSNLKKVFLSWRREGFNVTLNKVIRHIQINKSEIHISNCNNISDEDVKKERSHSRNEQCINQQIFSKQATLPDRVPININPSLISYKNELGRLSNLLNIPLTALENNIPDYLITKTSNKFAVYTAIFGDYDIIQDPEYIHEDVDYICFTDNINLKSNVFQIILVTPLFKSQTKNARMIKLLSHVFLYKYAKSLWIDGSTKIRGVSIREGFDKCLKDHDIALHAHFQRNCIYQEAQECISLGKDKKEILLNQIDKYRVEGYPENVGLVETAQIYRNHNTSINKFNESWWEELSNNSNRDQVSFNYVAWKTGIKYFVLDGCQWLDQSFKNYFHKDESLYYKKNCSSVSLVMLVRNSIDITKIAISSILEKTDYYDFELLVVDNDSDLETKEYLKNLETKNDNVRIVTNKHNLSFSQANNEAVDLCKNDLILFINNDIQIIQNNWLNILVGELQKDQSLGLVAPILLYPNYKIQSAGINITITNNTITMPAQELKTYSHPKFVDAVSGACFLVERKTHDLIGGFDERFFYGQEDIDYCNKVIEAGYSIKLLTQCEVLHNESSTRKFTVKQLRNREKIKSKWYKRIHNVVNKNSTPKTKMTYLQTLKTREINYKTLADLTNDLRKNAHLIPDDVDLVVGVPRSGMIPAYIIGQMKNIPVISFDEYSSGITPTKGDRKINIFQNDLINVLVVDDSINFGNSFARIKRSMPAQYQNKKCNIKYLSIYGSENWINDEVLTIEHCPLPRLFQWNYLNHGIASYSCFDLDGVLCIDPTDEENDDGILYEQFLKTAVPLHIPKYKIKAIVTSRLEKYRKLTEKWLKENNVQYEKLYMLDLPSKAERIKLNSHAKFKAEVFISMEDSFLFVESNIGQAKEIAKRTGKKVICTANDMIY